MSNIGGPFIWSYESEKFNERYANALNDVIGTPLHKIRSHINISNVDRNAEIVSVLKEHHDEISQIIEQKMAEKGFIKLRKEELVCTWRACPACELKPTVPHFCYDGKIPVPVDLKTR